MQFNNLDVEEVISIIKTKLQTKEKKRLMTLWKPVSMKKLIGDNNQNNNNNNNYEDEKENELNENLKRQLHSLLVSETDYLHHLDTIVKVLFF